DDRIKYDPEKVRELVIESIGDQFVDMYIMDVPNLAIRKIFIKTKERLSWDDIVADGHDKIVPYFRDLYGYGIQVHLTQGLKGDFIYVKDGVSVEQELYGQVH
ncbi:MAG: hypothetical protein FWG68_04360, partial [Defluviitaleaceae bacterium]|nr:hypothetical protein [Defluviitaleaceae bacterium]